MLDSDHVILLTLSTKETVSHRTDAKQTISAMPSKLFGSYFRVVKLKYGDSASLEAFSPLSPPRCESRSKGFRKCQHDCRQICGHISFIMRVAISLSHCHQHDLIYTCYHHHQPPQLLNHHHFSYHHHHHL